MFLFRTFFKLCVGFLFVCASLMSLVSQCTDVNKYSEMDFAVFSIFFSEMNNANSNSVFSLG